VTVDDTESAHSFSSSRSGLDSVLPDPNAPDSPQQGRRNRRRAEAVPEHKETAAEDVSVGKYYLDNKNWKAAQSRFQSAMVLSPEDPDVYWGLAESARHLGDVTSARANYLKVIEYDPDSRHAKDAAKTLKTPEMAEKTK
jgi:predicted Zn-dependent protease